MWSDFLNRAIGVFTREHQFWKISTFSKRRAVCVSPFWYCRTLWVYINRGGKNQIKGRPHYVLLSTTIKQSTHFLRLLYSYKAQNLVPSFVSGHHVNYKLSRHSTALSHLYLLLAYSLFSSSLSWSWSTFRRNELWWERNKLIPCKERDAFLMLLQLCHV